MPSPSPAAPDRLIFAVDTSSSLGSVALSRGPSVLRSRTFGEGQSHSQLLLPSVKALFEETGLDLGEVDLFAAVIGPGSFTGLRVSLACVRGLASEKPCFGAVASDVAAWAARDRGRDILALTDLFHGEIFGGLYNASGDLKSARESGLLEPVMEALRPLASKAPVLIGSAAMRYKDELARSLPQGVFVELREGLAPHLAHLASTRANEGTTCRASDLLPFYLRDPLTRGLPAAARRS